LLKLFKKNINYKQNSVKYKFYLNASFSNFNQTSSLSWTNGQKNNTQINCKFNELINVVLKLRLFLFLSNKNIRIKKYWLFAEEVFCIFNFFRLNQGSTYKIVIYTNVFYVFHHHLKSSLYFGVFEHFLNRRKKKLASVDWLRSQNVCGMK